MTHLTPAQAAQQSNRARDGKYSTKEHAEVDGVELTGTDLTRAIAHQADVTEAERLLRRIERDESNWPTGDQVDAILEVGRTRHRDEPWHETVKRAEEVLTNLGEDLPTGDQVDAVLSANVKEGIHIPGPVSQNRGVYREATYLADLENRHEASTSPEFLTADGEIPRSTWMPRYQQMSADYQSRRVELDPKDEWAWCPMCERCFRAGTDGPAPHECRY